MILWIYFFANYRIELYLGVIYMHFWVIFLRSRYGMGDIF